MKSRPSLFWLYISGSLLFVIGYGSYFLVIFLLLWSWNKAFSSKELRFSVYKLVSFLVLFSVISSLFCMIGSQDSVARFQRAGIVGLMISDFLVKYLGVLGTYIVLLMLGALATLAL